MLFHASMCFKQLAAMMHALKHFFIGVYLARTMLRVIKCLSSLVLTAPNLHFVRNYYPFKLQQVSLTDDGFYFYLRQGWRIMCFGCLSVCQSVCRSVISIAQKRVDRFG